MIDLDHAAFAELGGDAVMRGGFADHLARAGTRRRNSSKKFSRKTTCTEPFSGAAFSGRASTAKRLPSGARSRCNTPPGLKTCRSHQSRGLPGRKESPEAV